MAKQERRRKEELDYEKLEEKRNDEREPRTGGRGTELMYPAVRLSIPRMERSEIGSNVMVWCQVAIFRPLVTASYRADKISFSLSVAILCGRRLPTDVE